MEVSSSLFKMSSLFSFSVSALVGTMLNILCSFFSNKCHFWTCSSHNYKSLTRPQKPTILTKLKHLQLKEKHTLLASPPSISPSAMPSQQHEPRACVVGLNRVSRSFGLLRAFFPLTFIRCPPRQQRYRASTAFLQTVVQSSRPRPKDP